MQVYRDLPILTAQPDAADMVAGAAPALWLSGSRRCLRCAALGGTGGGRDRQQSWRPAVCRSWWAGRGSICGRSRPGSARCRKSPDDIREPPALWSPKRVRRRLHALLADRDPQTAERLKATDRQRMARAWEVLHGERTAAVLVAGTAAGGATPAIASSTSSSTPTGPCFIRPSMAAFKPWWRGVPWTRWLRRKRLPGKAVAGGRKAVGYPELAAAVAGTVRPRGPPSSRRSRRPGAMPSGRSPGFGSQMPNANFISPDLPAMKFSQSYCGRNAPQNSRFPVDPLVISH